MRIRVFRQAYSRLTNASRDLKTKAEFYRAKRALLASEDLTEAEKQLLKRISLQVHHRTPCMCRAMPANISLPGYLRAVASKRPFNRSAGGVNALVPIHSMFKQNNPGAAFEEANAQIAIAVEDAMINKRNKLQC
jgi:hypothetical protein